MAGDTMTVNHGYFDKNEKELVDHIADNAVIGEQTPALAEMQRRFVVAVRAASDSADTQTAEVIKLTNTLRVLTIVLVVMGAIQIGLMFWK